jgi:O-antigen/teichoic acid export membrane protein
VTPSDPGPRDLIVRQATALARAVLGLARQSLFANAGYLLAVEAVNSVAGFVFWTIAAHRYRPEDIGAASAIMSAVALVSLIGGLGTGNAVVRFLPEARDDRRFLNTTFLFNTLAAIIVSLSYLGGLSWWSPSLLYLRRTALTAIGFILYGVALTLTGGTRMALLACKSGRLIFYQAVSINAVRTILLVSVAGLGTLGLVLANGAGVVTALALSLLVFLPQALPDYRFKLECGRRNLVSILPYSFGTYLGGLLSQFPPRILPIIMFEMLGPAVAGYAQMAWLLGGLLTTPGIALAGSAFAEASNRPDRTSLVLAKAGLAGLLLTLMLGAATWAAAPFILLWFGPAYAAEATGLLRWLALSGPFVVAAWLYFTSLRVQLRVTRLVILGATVALISVGFAAASVSRWGLASCGIGWLAGHGIVVLAAGADAIKHRDTPSLASIASKAGALVKRSVTL